MPALPNASPDLVWQVVRNNNSFLVKTKTNGGVQFSRDPLNLTNTHTRKHAGFVNHSAIGVSESKDGVISTTKKNAAKVQQPAACTNIVAYSKNKSARKTYKVVANMSAASGYRPDLREAAVSRVSAIRKSQRPVKPSYEKKLRGKKAKAAAEEA